MEEMVLGVKAFSDFWNFNTKVINEYLVKIKLKDIQILVKFCPKSPNFVQTNITCQIL